MLDTRLDGTLITVRLAVADWYRLPEHIQQMIQRTQTLAGGIPINGELVLTMPAYRFDGIKRAMQALPVR